MAGKDENAAESVLDPVDDPAGAACNGNEAPSGAAEKNSFAMRSSVTGSKGLADRKSAIGEEPGCPVGSAPNPARSTSLVLMVMSNLDIIEHGDRIVC
jgi:hypothetical protein